MFVIFSIDFGQMERCLDVKKSSLYQKMWQPTQILDTEGITGDGEFISWF